MFHESNCVISIWQHELDQFGVLLQKHFGANQTHLILLRQSVSQQLVRIEELPTQHWLQSTPKIKLCRFDSHRPLLSHSAPCHELDCLIDPILSVPQKFVKSEFGSKGTNSYLSSANITLLFVIYYSTLESFQIQIQFLRICTESQPHGTFSL